MFQRWQNQNGCSETIENWECGLGTERAKWHLVSTSLQISFFAKKKEKRKNVEEGM